jgi:hypothetical protein
MRFIHGKWNDLGSSTGPPVFAETSRSLTSSLPRREQLASDIERRMRAPPRALRDGLLRDAVRPYLQAATDDIDEWTGLRLLDVWRYCRMTWSLPFSTQPGRRMYYLVRDASREFHPVMGIGALGNSVVQITCRDRAIGWTLDGLFDGRDHADKLAALERGLDRAVDGTYWEDLLAPDEVANPTAAVIESLDKNSSSGPLTSRWLNTSGPTATLLEETLSPFYRKKRATVLARLLSAKSVFARFRSEASTDEGIVDAMLANEVGRRALKTALRAVKKEHVGSSIMEVTACGALPPYGDLLGGKLVGLLMASPQVIADYEGRYSEQESVIASRMKGEPVSRRARLALLGTTSLYHVGSSQYNRLRAPAEKGEIRYDRVGQTDGYGSVHLSRRTFRSIQRLLEAHPDLEPHGSRFAQGVNYKIRSLASALSALGLQKLQRHRTPRIVYAVPLASNWKEYLTGQTDDLKSLHDGQSVEEGTRALIEYWKERWFLARAQRLDVRDRLKRTTKRVRVSDALRDKPPPCGPLFTTARPTGQASGPTASHTPKPIRRMIPWHTLAELMCDRASFAERLTDDELASLHVRTRMDDGFLTAVRAGKRIYLSGNPGDGKTHLIRRFKSELEEAGAIVHLDASADDEDSVAALIREAVESGRPAVIAVNEGPLRRLRSKLPSSDAEQVAKQLARPLLYGDADDVGYDALVVNMGLRRVLVPEVIEEVLGLVLHRVDYTGAPKGVLKNRSALADHVRVRERIKALLELVAQSGGHVTMHRLLGFFSHIITGALPPNRADPSTPTSTLRSPTRARYRGGSARSTRWGSRTLSWTCGYGTGTLEATSSGSILRRSSFTTSRQPSGVSSSRPSGGRTFSRSSLRTAAGSTRF